MAEEIKELFSISLKKLWLIYKSIETSPSQIGPSKVHKAAVFFMYTVALVIAIVLMYQVLTYQAVFTGVVMHGPRDGKVEIPSALICPEKETYEYAFFHWKEEIELLNLTTEAVNFLAKMAYEGRLSDDSAKQNFKKFNAKDEDLTTLWQSVASEQYFLHVNNRRKEYAEGKCEIIGGDWRDQFGEVLRDKRCFLHIKGVGRDYVTRPFSYGVPNVEGLWLRDKRFCFFINMTGKLMTLWDHFHKSVDSVFEFYHEHYQSTPKNRALAKKFPHLYHVFMPIKKMYFWFGNVKTQEIKLSETYLERAPTAHVRLSLYKKQGVVPAVCQPLLEEKCAKAREVVKNPWTSLTTMTMVQGIGQAIALRVEVLQWYEIEQYMKFSSIAMIEIIGNFLGICTGLSILGISKFLVILIFGLKKKMTKHKLIASIEMGLFCFFGVVTICCLVYKAYSTYKSSDSRFYLQYDMKRLAEGTPFPNVEFCPYLLESFNYTTIKRYNISYRLLMYIGSLAVLQPPTTFLQEAKVTKPYFLYDEQAPAELGYYWTFMRFPLWKVNKELYENYMQAAETEYEKLCQKLGIDSTQPAWNIYIQLLLDPCQLIDRCVINGISVDCCKGFRHKTALRFSDFPVCMIFTEGEKYTQTVYDQDHGLQIYMNYDTYMNHRLDHPWYDDYVRNYIRQCKLAYNCSTEWPHGWNRGNGMDIHLAPGVAGYWQCTGLWCNQGDRNFAPGKAVTIPIGYRRTDLLEHNENSNCANKDPPLSEMWYLKTELIRRRCGCNVCMDDQRNEPCCQPKSLGRCLTKEGMYQSLCRKNKMNPIQTDYPAKLPSNIPVHGLLGDIEQCSVDLVFGDPKSTFYPDFVEMKKDMTQIMKKACIRYEPVGGQGQIQLSSTTDEADSHLVLYNFYYYSPLVEEFQEFDRLNVWQIFSLLCGMIGLILGITVIGSLKKLYEVILMRKEFFKPNYFVFATLNKLDTRFTHFIKKSPNDPENAVHPIQIEELQHGASNNQQDGNIYNDRTDTNTPHSFPTVGARNSSMTTCPNIPSTSTSKDQMEQNIPDTSGTNCITKDPRVVTPNGARNSSTTTCPNIPSTSQDQMEQNIPDTSGTNCITKDPRVVTPNGARNSSTTTCPNIPSTSQGQMEQNIPETSDTSINTPKASAGHGIIVMIGLAGMLFCISQMYKVIIDNQINVLYSVTDENIEIPSLGLCMFETSRYAELSKYVKSPLVRCEVDNKMVSCSDLLVVYLQTASYSCVVSLLPNSKSLKLSLPAPLSITNFWIGDLKQVENLNLAIDVNMLLKEGFIYYIFYEQYEIVDKTFCSSETYLCPYCPQHQMLGSSDYCCLKKGLKLRNLSSPRFVESCNKSAYQVSINEGKPAYSPTNDTTTHIQIQSSAYDKRRITREFSRTSSEKIMLYSGFIDLFLGINLDNTVYALLAFIGTLILKKFATE